MCGYLEPENVNYDTERLEVVGCPAEEGDPEKENK